MEGLSLRLKLELDEDTTVRLVERAATERRPVPWQAEVMLREALGLPFPYPERGGGAEPWSDADLEEESAAKA